MLCASPDNPALKGLPFPAASLGLELSVSALARLKGVKRQTIAERLARLEEQGLISSRRQGKSKLVRLAEWDTVTSEHSDLSRLVGAETAKVARGAAAADDPLTRDPTYNAELTRKAGFEADLKEIALRRLRGALVDRAELEKKAELVAEKIVRTLDQIPTFAEDFAAALTRDGIPGLRTELKMRVREIRKTLAAGMSQLATTSEVEDEDDDAEEPFE
jgi:DNA-binding transcriptional ArsR family regulator